MPWYWPFGTKQEAPQPQAAVAPQKTMVAAHPVEVIVSKAPDRGRDSDFKSPAAAVAALSAIHSHLARQKAMGRDQSRNCENLRAKRDALLAYLAEQRAALMAVD